MKIGVISDIHKRPYLVPYLLEEMKKSGVDVLYAIGEVPVEKKPDVNLIRLMQILDF